MCPKIFRTFRCPCLKIGKMSRHWLWMIPQELFPHAHLKRLYWLPKDSYFVMQFSLDSTVCSGWFFHAAKVIIANRGKIFFFLNSRIDHFPRQFDGKKSRCAIRIFKSDLGFGRTLRHNFDFSFFSASTQYLISKCDNVKFLSWLLTLSQSKSKEV